MLLSSLRDESFSSDNLTIPPRPIVKAVLLGVYRRKGEADSCPSAMYRITLVQQQTIKPKTTMREHAAVGGEELKLRRPLQPKGHQNHQTSCQEVQHKTDMDVVQLEVFACVQRLNHPEITRWRQIAQVDLRKRRGTRDSVASLVKKVDDITGRSSVRIVGFCPGYKYQIVVRGVGPHGKRSLFSQPISIVPPAYPVIRA